MLWILITVIYGLVHLSTSQYVPSQQSRSRPMAMPSSFDASLSSDARGEQLLQNDQPSNSYGNAGNQGGVGYGNSNPSSSYQANSGRQAEVQGYNSGPTLGSQSVIRPFQGGGANRPQSGTNQGSSNSQNPNPQTRPNSDNLGFRPEYCKRPTGQFSVASDCSKFYNCHENMAWIMDCPEGLGFNEAISACDYGNAIGCAGARAPATGTGNGNNNNYGNGNWNAERGGSNTNQNSGQQNPNYGNSGNSNVGGSGPPPPGHGQNPASNSGNSRPPGGYGAQQPQQPLQPQQTQQTQQTQQPQGNNNANNRPPNTVDFGPSGSGGSGNQYPGPSSGGNTNTGYGNNPQQPVTSQGNNNNNNWSPPVPSQNGGNQNVGTSNNNPGYYHPQQQIPQQVQQQAPQQVPQQVPQQIPQQGNNNWNNNGQQSPNIPAGGSGQPPRYHPDVRNPNMQNSNGQNPNMQNINQNHGGNPPQPPSGNDFNNGGQSFGQNTPPTTTQLWNNPSDTGTGWSNNNNRPVVVPPCVPAGSGSPSQTPSSFDPQTGFAVIEPQRPGQWRPPNTPANSTGANSGGLSDSMTFYGPNGPQSSPGLRCQPCQQLGSTGCANFPNSKCFDDVCGGCKARFFVPRPGSPSPFAEVTSMCISSTSGGESFPLQDNSNRLQPYA